MQNKMVVTDFVSGIKRVETWSDFEKLARVDHHGLKEFTVKYIEGELKAGGKRSRSYFVEVGLWIIPNVANVFTKLTPSRGI